MLFVIFFFIKSLCASPFTLQITVSEIPGSKSHFGGLRFAELPSEVSRPAVNANAEFTNYRYLFPNQDKKLRIHYELYFFDDL